MKTKSQVHVTSDSARALQDHPQCEIFETKRFYKSSIAIGIRLECEKALGIYSVERIHAPTKNTLHGRISKTHERSLLRRVIDPDAVKPERHYHTCL
jgi:hypothetical protein